MPIEMIEEFDQGTQIKVIGRSEILAARGTTAEMLQFAAKEADFSASFWTTL